MSFFIFLDGLSFYNSNIILNEILDEVSEKESLIIVFYLKQTAIIICTIKRVSIKLKKMLRLIYIL
jgi:hypothetical protein